MHVLGLGNTLRNAPPGFTLLLFSSLSVEYEERRIVGARSYVWAEA